MSWYGTSQLHREDQARVEVYGDDALNRAFLCLDHDKTYYIVAIPEKLKWFFIDKFKKFSDALCVSFYIDCILKLAKSKRIVIKNNKIFVNNSDVYFQPEDYYKLIKFLLKEFNYRIDNYGVPVKIKKEKSEYDGDGFWESLENKKKLNNVFNNAINILLGE